MDDVSSIVDRFLDDVWISFEWFRVVSSGSKPKWFRAVSSGFKWLETTRKVVSSHSDVAPLLMV